MIRKKNKIITKIKSKYWIRTHKFGIEIPKSVEDVKRIDQANTSTNWWDDICKDMKNVRIMFKKYDGKQSEIPSNYTKINCHLIFELKMGENFRRRSRMVAGGHVNDVPSSITYYCVVLRDSAQILFMIALLNYLKVLSCDIQNAYLTAPTREKIWTIDGPEFGSEKGCIMMVF